MQTTDTQAPATVDADTLDTGHRATYSPEDNKLRIYPAHRLSAEEYARVKAAGYSWAPKQELFVAPMWTPAREDLARELCGEIGDEDTTLAERAEERADRFADYSDKRASDAASARAGVEAIAGRFEFGQPILIGHHSQRKAERDAERMQAGMRRAVDMWETAGYWKARAAGAIRAAKYKERPDVRARRIKGIEADLRKVERSTAEATEHARRWAVVARKLAEGAPAETVHALALHVANFDHVSRCYPLADFPRDPPASQYEGQMGLWSALDGGVITPAQAVEIATRAHEHGNDHRARWAAHYANRLEYERAMLAEGGGLVADQHDLQPGGQVLARGEWAVILRVNRKEGRAVSVTVTGRSWGALGVEEIKDYRPATEEAAAAVKAATAKAPLCNYPSEGCATMTAAEWAKIYTDSKGTRETKATATHAAHRRRSLPGYVAQRFGAPRGDQWGWAPVFISDAKRTDPPTIGGDPDKPKRKRTAQKMAEAAGAAPAPAPQAEPAPVASAAAAPAPQAAPTPTAPENSARSETPELIAHAGRLFRVLAKFPDTDEGAAAANAHMEANDGAALLCIRAGVLYLAHRDDRGTEDAPTLRAEARALLADIAAPGPFETAQQIERMQARQAARAEREAEAAPFEAMRQALKTGQAVQVVSAPQLFPTPAHVAARMVALARLPHSAGVPPRVLEPSAGAGAVLRALQEAYAGTPAAAPVVYAVEINHGLAQRLRASFESVHLHTGDFLDVDPGRLQPFDVVLMNPPFAPSAADVRHILHARRFLAPGGRLVAICAAGPRQHDALQGLADSWEYLPPGTFEGTNVRTVLLTMGAAS